MLRNDIRIAIRSLRQNPDLTLSGIATLAVAVAMATCVFGIVNAILLRPLPYPDSGRLAVIEGSSHTEARGPVSFDDFEDWRIGSKTIESAAVYSSYYNPVLTGNGTAERLSALLISHEYFAVLGARPRLGRFFNAAEDRDGRDFVVVLSYALWRERFQSDPSVIGRTILLNAQPHVIVGVAGPSLLPLPTSMDVRTPQIYRPVGEPFGMGSRDGRHLETIVRLRPGATIAQAQAELNVRCEWMRKQYPDADAHLAVHIAGLHDAMTRDVRAPLLSLQAAVLVLLLMACANMANLLLAKSSGRQREMAIREALGAGRAQLARMLLTESLLLGLAGSFCGVLLAVWGSAGLTAVAARVLPDAGFIAVDSRVLAFAAILSLVVSAMFGMAPVTRLGALRLDDALKHGVRVSGDGRNALRRSLAAIQVALAMILLVATGLLGKSFLRLRSVNPGFDARGVLTASLTLPSARYSTPALTRDFVNRLLAGVSAIPGVRGVAMTSVVPLSANFDRTGFDIEGRPTSGKEEVSPDRYIVTPDYFRVMKIPLHDGRLFTARDDAAGLPVCIISETAARRWFPGESPLGRKIRAGGFNTEFAKTPFRKVIGVVADVAQYGLGHGRTPQIYLPHAQYPSRYLSLMVLGPAEPQFLAQPIRTEVLAMDSELPVFDVEPLEDIVADTVASRRAGLWMLIAFGFGALALSAAGIYGMMSYSVSRRIAEFGIRMALGARSGDVFRQAITDALRITAIGLAAGVAGAVAVARLLARYLYGVKPDDVATFIAVAGVLAVVALAACYLPARRAATVDPVTALRNE
ncbi:MAG TPA: ABC transporter permease [Candidatus Limnocylindrales bacterium]|nr:ABC transporter permease [Candidatus Limnocylindrales bacterium]